MSWLLAFWPTAKSSIVHFGSAARASHSGVKNAVPHSGCLTPQSPFSPNSGMNQWSRW